MSVLVGNEGPLPPEWKDHPLKAEWEGFRECHAGGDLLLVYELKDAGETIVFVRAGTHAEIFR